MTILQNAPVRTSAPPVPREGEGRLPLPALPPQKHLRPQSKLRRFLSLWPLAAAALGSAALFSLMSNTPMAAMALAPLFGFAYARFYKLRTFKSENSEEVVKINKGKPDIRALDSMAYRFRNIPKLHSEVLFNLGVSELKNGAPQRALSLFAAFLKSQPSRSLKQMVPYHIAICHGLLGDVAAAQEWLEEGDDRNEYEHLRADTLARAIIWCRRHEFKQAASFLDEEWSRIDAMFIGKMRHAHSVLRAFALVESGVHVDHKIVQALVVSAKLSRHHFRFMANHWNEMQSFLATHDLLQSHEGSV